MLENEHLRVRLDPTTGGIVSLVHKASGREMLDAGQGACPRLTGKPNPNLSLRPNPPAFYDTAKSKAAIDWLAKGPLYAEVRAQHAMPYLRFETRIRLAAGSPYIEIYSRMFASLPPHSDAWPPANIKEGYWLSFTPAFPVTRCCATSPSASSRRSTPISTPSRSSICWARTRACWSCIRARSSSAARRRGPCRTW